MSATVAMARRGFPLIQGGYVVNAASGSGLAYVYVRE
jgi:hypothetical protein